MSGQAVIGFLAFAGVVAGVAYAVAPSAAALAAAGKGGGGTIPPDAMSDDVLAPAADGMSSQEAMARTMWGEARGEGPEGMRAVGCVIKNRAAFANALKFGFPAGDIAAVCLQRRQFSCWNVGDPNRVLVLRVTQDDRTYAQCLDMAGRIISGALSDNTHGAQYFYASSIAAPEWTKKMTRVATIGHHFFYRA